MGERLGAGGNTRGAGSLAQGSCGTICGGRGRVAWSVRKGGRLMSQQLQECMRLNAGGRDMGAGGMIARHLGPGCGSRGLDFPGAWRPVWKVWKIKQFTVDPEVSDSQKDMPSSQPSLSTPQFCLPPIRRAQNRSVRGGGQARHHQHGHLLRRGASPKCGAPALRRQVRVWAAVCGRGFSPASSATSAL